MSPVPQAQNHFLYTYTPPCKSDPAPQPTKMQFTPTFNDPEKFALALETMRWDQMEDAWHRAVRSKDMDSIVSIAKKCPTGYYHAAKEIIIRSHSAGEKRDHYLKKIE